MSGLNAADSAGKDQAPVSADLYDEKWIASAWGSKGNKDVVDDNSLSPRPRVSYALKLLDLHPGQTVLDIACGRGEIPALAAAAGAHAVGIDFSSASLQFAARVKDARQASFPGGASMALVQADATRLPFADGSFDRIAMLDIIEHLTPAQLNMMFTEVARLLKPQGFAVIHTLPNRWVYDVTFPMLHRFSSRFPRDPRGPIDRMLHINEQVLPQLEDTVEANGLKHRMWLSQLMPAQARWNAQNDTYGDNRDAIYPMLQGPIGRLLELLSRTPFKLILCNDIYGILWKQDALPEGAKVEFAPVERLASFFLRRKKQP